MDSAADNRVRSAVLAIHPGALGDVVLLGHLLTDFAPVRTVVARGSKGELLVASGRAERALDFDALPMHELFAEGSAGSGELAAALGACDVLISCLADGDSQAARRLVRMCGARQAHFLPVRPAGMGRHLLDVWRRTLSIRPSRKPPEPWSVPARWRKAAGDVLREAGLDPAGRYIVLHPGAGSPAKCWPLDYFMRLAGELPVRPVFVLGPVEQDRWPRRQLEAVRQRFATLVCPSLAVFAGVLTGAIGYLGNDSGPSHLAAALGTPTLALFGPTSPQQFAPVGRAVRTIHGEPLARLEVDCVAERLEQLLAAAGGS